MALPTLRPYSVLRSGRAAEQERRMARRRNQEEQIRRSWADHSRYLHKLDILSTKQEAWSSESAGPSYNGVVEMERVRGRREEGKQQLGERRNSLRQLLLQEQLSYESELKKDAPDKLSHMKNRVDQLKSAREEKRKKEAEEKRVSLWRENCPELREAESRRGQKAVQIAWQDQIQHKEKEKKQVHREEKRYDQHMEEERLEAERREEELRRKQKSEEKAHAEALQRQMAEIKIRESEAAQLEREHARLLQKQAELGEAEERRKQLETEQRGAELGRVLVKQAKAQLRRKSQRIQESLELDLRILEDLAKHEVEEQAVMTERRERARVDAAWMRQVVKEQLELERQREAELELFYQEEAMRMWSQREEEWGREKQARERLMAEVLAERQKQLEERMELVKTQQAESIQQREELLTEMELETQRTARELKKKGDTRTARASELQTQVMERRRKAERMKEEYERELEEQRRVEEEYEALVRREEQRISTGHSHTKFYGRRKQAWY